MSQVLQLPVPEPGQLVDVRRRRYVVMDIVQSPLPPDILTSGSLLLQRQHLVTLSSVEDDALGEELQVIWEIEPGATAIDKMPLPRPVGFDTPQRLDTFLNAVRWGAASSADVKAIQAPFRSGVDLEDYQLDPVARAIQMPRVNLLIADDVGLGKTIEAGLVAQELIIRHRARRILIVCPAALQVQWHDQMRDKFGLEFRIVDSKLLHDLRRERGLYVNPWTHFPRLITSIDFLKRERPMRLLSEILPAHLAPMQQGGFRDLAPTDRSERLAGASGWQQLSLVQIDGQRLHVRAILDRCTDRKGKTAQACAVTRGATDRLDLMLLRKQANFREIEDLAAFCRDARNRAEILTALTTDRGTVMNDFIWLLFHRECVSVMPHLASWLLSARTTRTAWQTRKPIRRRWLTARSAIFRHFLFEIFDSGIGLGQLFFQWQQFCYQRFEDLIFFSKRLEFFVFCHCSTLVDFLDFGKPIGELSSYHISVWSGWVGRICF